ncbi:transcription termination/antitermination protein NusG [Nitrobacter sp. TKz-YC02]|uniref:transcription termination/antitermination protein NusG n=1 Tax=Nitrobacter sp. TKz-YC02 TaxID=3398704 RepID=UPI003CF5E592
MIGELQRLEIGQLVGTVDLDALHGPASVPMQPQCWFILRTHPGCERKVMREFERRNISAYCPRITKQQRVTRSVRGSSWTYEIKRLVEVPLFPQLVFVPDFERVPTDISGVSGWLRFGEWRARIPSERKARSGGVACMADIHALVAIANTPQSKREAKFDLGDLVRIVDGPFRDFSGRIERLDSKGRLKVAIQIFGRLSPAVVSEWQIEPSQYPTDVCTVRERRKPRRGSFSCR